jgi:hypothetical protein
MELNCIHCDHGLCPDCRADFEADQEAWYEFGNHPAGIANWKRLLEEIAAHQADEGEPVEYAGEDIPF